MLKPHLEPSAGFYALAELERRGKLQCSIANNVHNLPGRAGCQKVLNLHGTIYDNECPRCGRKYSMEYIRDAKRVPLCEDCMAVIRPKVLLFGEQVDNRMMTAGCGGDREGGCTAASWYLDWLGALRAVCEVF